MKDTKIIEYHGEHFSKYAKDRADMITQGWKVLDVCLIQKDIYMNGSVINTFVRGTVTYGKS